MLYYLYMFMYMLIMYVMYDLRFSLIVFNKYEFIAKNRLEILNKIINNQGSRSNPSRSKLLLTAQQF